MDKYLKLPVIEPLKPKTEVTNFPDTVSAVLDIKKRKNKKKNDRKARIKEKKKQTQRDHLQREIIYGNLNIKKLNRYWRQMLVDITVPKMKKEFIYAWHRFEKVIDNKDFIISLLMDQIYQHEELFIRSLSNHLEKIDQIIKLSRKTSDDIYQDFIVEKNNLKDKEIEQKKKINDALNSTEIHINTISFGMERLMTLWNRDLSEKKFMTTTTEFALFDDAVFKIHEQFEKKVHSLRRITAAVFDDMTFYFKDRLESYESMLASEKKGQEIIHCETNRILKYRRIGKKLRDHLEALERENLQVLGELRVEFRFYDRAAFKLKRMLEKELTRDQSQKVLISVGFQNAFDFLKELLKRGETMIKCMMSCRRYETAKEKVLPYLVGEKYVPSHRTINIPTLFWQKIGSADLVRRELKEEKQHLLKEQKLLLDKMKGMCRCFSCYMNMKKRPIVLSSINLTKGRVSKIGCPLKPSFF